MRWKVAESCQFAQSMDSSQFCFCWFRVLLGTVPSVRETVKKS